MPSVKTGKKRDKMVILELFKLEKDELANSVHLPQQKTKRKREMQKNEMRWLFLVFLE